MTHDDCTEGLLGVWSLGGSCAPNECPGVPANDDCSTPLVVSGADVGIEVLVAGHNICATDDGPELSTDPNWGGCAPSVAGGADLHHDVWFLYEKQRCGGLMIDSCNDADFDQMIAVYDATSGCPVDTLQEIHCNDDGCGSGAGPSVLEIFHDEGDRFLIRVGGWSNPQNELVGSPRGRFNLRFVYTIGGQRTPSIAPPLPAAPPHDIMKNRYISIDPRGAGGINHGRRFYIQVRLTETLVDGVVPPLTFWASEPDENCISIVVPEQPAEARYWHDCPTLHLTGCPIIPTTTYAIETLNCGNYSGPLVVQTQAKPGAKFWGDAVGSFEDGEWTPPQGVVSFEDVVAAIKTFQDPNAFNATHVSVTDVHPNRPDLGGISVHPNIQVNIDDVFQFVRCFQGEAYLGGQLELCTSP